MAVMSIIDVKNHKPLILKFPVVYTSIIVDTAQIL